MLSTAHLMLGGALGSLLKRRPAVFAAGVVSHHLADCVLHTDTGTFREGDGDQLGFSHREALVAAGDLALGCMLLYLASRRHPQRVPILIGALAGILPDLIDNAPGVAPRFRATGFGRGYHAMHCRLHHTARPDQWLPGLVTQLVVVAAGAALLRR